MTLVPIAYPRGLRGPVPNVVPLTIRENPSQQYLIEEMRDWIVTKLVPFINTNLDELDAEWVKEVNRLIDAWNEQSAELIVAVDAAKDQAEAAAIEAEAAKVAAAASAALAEMFASQAAAIQDTAITSIFNNTSSAFRTAANGVFAPISLSGTVNALAETVADNKAEAATELAEAIDTVNASIATKLDASEASKFALKTELPIQASGYGVASENADNTVALQNAINDAITAQRPLELPSGTIKTGTLNFSGPITLIGRGKAITKLAYTSTTAGLTLRASGSVARGVGTLTANAARGDSTITVASTANIFAGDVLILHDSASYVSTDASYKSGEQIRVKQVLSATQFTIHGAVRGSWGDAGRAYTVANSSIVSKITFVEGITIRDLTISAPQTQTSGAIRLEYCKTVTLENIDIPSGGTLGIFVLGCRDVTITNPTIHDLTNDLANGFNGYAITTSQSCENVTIVGGHIYNVRHGFTTIGGDLGMPHGITVTGVTLSECTGNALDTHAAGEGIIFNGNVITSGVGGISVRSRGTMVVNNTIQNSSSHGIAVTEGIAGEIDIKNNTLMRINGGVHGIAVREKCDNLRITGNTISDVGADGIWVSADSNTVYIADNYIKNIGRSLNGRNGIVAHTTGGIVPITGGWQVIKNMFVQAIGSAARAVYGTGGVGMTMMSVYNNYATGTFTVTQFEFASNKGAGNQVI